MAGQALKLRILADVRVSHSRTGPAERSAAPPISCIEEPGGAAGCAATPPGIAWCSAQMRACSSVERARLVNVAFCSGRRLGVLDRLLQRVGEHRRHVALVQPRHLLALVEEAGVDRRLAAGERVLVRLERRGQRLDLAGRRRPRAGVDLRHGGLAAAPSAVTPLTAVLRSVGRVLGLVAEALPDLLELLAQDLAVLDDVGGHVLEVFCRP